MGTTHEEQTSWITHWLKAFDVRLAEAVRITNYIIQTMNLPQSRIQ